MHGNQECNALATILWDNAFAEPVSSVVILLQLMVLDKLFATKSKKSLSVLRIPYLVHVYFAGSHAVPSAGSGDVVAAGQRSQHQVHSSVRPEDVGRELRVPRLEALRYVLVLMTHLVHA